MITRTQFEKCVLHHQNKLRELRTEQKILNQHLERVTVAIWDEENSMELLRQHYYRQGFVK